MLNVECSRLFLYEETMKPGNLNSCLPGLLINIFVNFACFVVKTLRASASFHISAFQLLSFRLLQFGVFSPWFSAFQHFSFQRFNQKCLKIRLLSVYNRVYPWFEKMFKKKLKKLLTPPRPSAIVSPHTVT